MPIGPKWEALFRIWEGNWPRRESGGPLPDSANYRENSKPGIEGAKEDREPRCPALDALYGRTEAEAELLA